MRTLVKLGLICAAGFAAYEAITWVVGVIQFPMRLNVTCDDGHGQETFCYRWFADKGDATGSVVVAWLEDINRLVVGIFWLGVLFGLLVGVAWAWLRIDAWRWRR
jgi:hypothetical protein